MGCSGAGCSLGLSGTINLATCGLAVFCANTTPLKHRSTINVRAKIAAVTLLFLAISSSPHAEKFFALPQALRFLCHHFFNAGAEILEDDGGCVAAGPTRYGATWMSR